jgi:hypothetical protein
VGPTAIAQDDRVFGYAGYRDAGYRNGASGEKQPTNDGEVYLGAFNWTLKSGQNK